MKTPGQKITRHLIIAWGLLIYGGFNSAQAITPAQVPLYVGISAAKPNIMLMLDSSGSMSTNVTTTSTASSPAGAPSTSVYTCNKPISGGVTPPVPMIVTSSGVPRFCATSTACSSTNQTSFSKNKCFNNSKSYDVAYYNGSTLAGGPYTGQQLNWYFSHGVFTPGSLSTSISATTTTTRTALAKQAAIDLITTLTPSSTGNVTVRMGLSRYNGSDGGTLLSEIKDLDSAQSATLQSQVSNIPASGITPLATTLSDIGHYFATGETGNLKLHPTTTNAAASVTSVFSKANGTTSHSIRNSTGVSPLAAPILGYCQKSFVILISDGLPNGDREISPLLRDYTGDCATKNLCVSTPDTNITLPGASGVALTSTNTQCNGSLHPPQWYNKACKNGTKAGRIYETGGSDYLDDVAQALYEMDLRPTLGAAKKAQIHVKNNVVTYAIGLADPSLQTQSVLSDAATVGGGKFYFAGDSKSLAAALDEAVFDISSQVGSSSSVAANSSKLENGSVIYQAKFDSADWTGGFSAFSLGVSEDTNGNGILDSGEDTNGNGILDAGSIGAKLWDAVGLIPAFGTRNIYTYNTSTSQGATFTCVSSGGLSATQKTTLGITDCNSSTDTGVWRLNYIRGDWSHEQKNPARTDTDTIRTGTNLIFRNRTHLDNLTSATVSPDPWVLGDIVNSDPIFVGADDFGYDVLPEGSNYKAFVTANAARRKMIYVGANDGMLHGFDANSAGADAGKEIIAYVPNAVYTQLNSLSDPGYNTNHVYSVDGSPRAGDAYFDGAWHTVLLSSTGAGGHAIFALDVTNPDTFASSNVLWEISDTFSPFSADLTDDTTTIRGFGNNMGYTLPQPTIARMQDGTWVAIVANGYASDNNLAVLYIIDIKTGQLKKAFDTLAGNSTTPNGLSTPFAVDNNNDKMVDAIYAGDLLGNLWKFDVSSSTPDNWKIAYGLPTTPAPLFVACTDAGNCNNTRQPITAKPQVGNVGSLQTGSPPGVMVYFGTGKYFEDDIDNIVTGAQTQSFYGIWDNNTVVSRSNLQQQTIIAAVTSGNFNLRATSDNTVNYPTQKGWYMDLLEPSATISNGERVVSAPLLRNGRIIFVTLIPIPPLSTVDICGTGSGVTSWLMELDGVTGKRLPATACGAPWDINGDGVINASDLITVTIDGQSVKIAPSGKQSTVGGGKTPGVISNGQLEYKYTSGTQEAELEVTTENSGGSSASTGIRKSWRQLFQ